MKKKTIMVVDDMAVFREPIAAAIKARGYEVVTAANGKDALQALWRHRPDLILLDVAMPEMDGFSFLRRMRGQPDAPQPPVLLLTAVAEKDHVLKAARLGAQGYLLKSKFSLTELFDRIRSLMETPATEAPSAPNEDGALSGDESEPEPPSLKSEPVESRTQTLKSLKPLLTRSEVLERLESASEMKAMSPTVSKILKLTDSEGCSVEQLAKTMKQDHAIAIKILKLANSSVYTRGEPVETLEKAIMRIGLAEIRQAILNISVVQGFGTVSIGEDVDPGQFWEHAIACGMIAAEIAHASSADQADAAFTMGLVHDIGRVIFAEQLGEQYAQVLEQARELQLPLEQVESRLFMINHADGMDRLLHAWRFPKNLIDPIVLHHLSFGNIRQTAPRRLEEVGTLALADRLCHALLLGSSGNDTIYPTEEFCTGLKVPKSVIAHIEENAREQTQDLKLTLLTETAGEGWMDARTRWQETLSVPFRPLYVSAQPEFDAYRMFCDQLRERTDERPNVAVVHTVHAREQDDLSRELARLEGEAKVRALPLIVLSPNGQLSLESGVLGERTVLRLATPVTVRRFIELVNNLLQTTSKEAA